MRICKWLVPVVVFGFLVAGVAPRVTAEDTKKTGGIKGSVTDKDGKAVASAKIGLMAPDKGKHGEAPAAEAKAKGIKGLAKGEKGAKQAPIAETTSDSEGKFELKDVAPGNYVVFARMKGVGGAKQDVEVKAGETAEVSLKLGDVKKGK